jgi:hypothetical protein
MPAHYLAYHTCHSWPWAKIPAHFCLKSAVCNVLSQVGPGVDLFDSSIVMMEDLLAELLMRLAIQKEDISFSVRVVMKGVLADRGAKSYNEQFE